MKPLLLASTSPYRAELLKKLGIPFLTARPKYDEDRTKQQLLQAQATPLQIAESLSKGKAYSVRDKDTGKGSEAVIIAGDQLVDFNTVILGKPHDFGAAKLQLQKMRGKSHQLITAVTILNAELEMHLNHITTLKMKDLSNTEIENYLKKDEPYDCAGSYKIEKSGLLLFSEISTDDFSAIQGLPLLWISARLKELGYEFFKN